MILIDWCKHFKKFRPQEVEHKQEEEIFLRFDTACVIRIIDNLQDLLLKQVKRL